MTAQAEPKPMESKKGKVEKKKPFPSDRKILDTLYAHYGKPKNIVKEKVKLYLQYVTPAGMSMGDWKRGEYQLGRVTIFTGVKDHPDDLYERTKIDREGKGSWFIGIKGDQIKVWIGGVIDNILTITN
jgi:hypothetical protein